jgi:PAS domain S-box-containing protein
MSCSAAKLVISTLNTSTEAILLLSTEGDILHANPVAKKKHAVENNKLMNNDDLHLLPKDIWQQVVNNGKATVPLEKLSLSLHLLEPCACCNTSFICAYINDVSKLKEYEQELEYREREAQAMIDASFDPMILIDEKGIIHVVNESAIQLFGWERHEFLGCNVSMICGGDHGEHHDEYLQRYLATREKRVIGRKRKVPAKRKDGSEFSIEIGVEQVETQQGELRFCAFIRDVTETNLMKFNMRKQQDLIQDTFFGGDNGEDADREPLTPQSAPGGTPPTKAGG